MFLSCCILCILQWQKKKKRNKRDFEMLLLLVFVQLLNIWGNGKSAFLAKVLESIGIS